MSRSAQKVIFPTSTNWGWRWGPSTFFAKNCMIYSDSTQNSCMKPFFFRMGWGGGVDQFPKMFFARNYNKCPDLHKNVSNPNCMEVWWGWHTKIFSFAMNFMKCPDLHRKVMHGIYMTWRTVANSDFCALLDIKCNSDINSFSELGPNFTCWRKNPYHSRKSKLSMTLNRESNSCVQEIVFGKLLQISQATICHPKHSSSIYDSNF